jgi:hypothetical protein
MRTLVYIDPTTATWGGADSLVIGELTDEQMETLTEGDDSTINDMADEMENRRNVVDFTVQDAQELVAALQAVIERKGDYLGSLDFAESKAVQLLTQLRS